MLQTAVQIFDGYTAELYPDAQGGILLLGDLGSVLREIHPCTYGSPSCISIHFLKSLSSLAATPFWYNGGAYALL